VDRRLCPPGDFTTPTPLASAGLAALLLALAALTALLARRFAARSDDGIAGRADPKPTRAELSDALAAVTRREAALQEQLADQRQFSHDLLDALPNPVFYKDGEARYLGCNQAFADAFGTTPEALIGKTVLELPFPPEVRSAHYARDLQILARKSTADLTLRLPFADGRQHDIFYRTRNFGLADGRAGGLLGVLVDLSSQQEASREARSAEETSRRILESSPVAIVINRTDGPPLFANSRAAELADTDMQEFMRRPAVSWFRDPALAGQLISRLQQGKPVRDFEIEFRRNSGEAPGPSSAWSASSSRAGRRSSPGLRHHQPQVGRAGAAQALAGRRAEPLDARHHAARRHHPVRQPLLLPHHGAPPRRADRHPAGPARRRRPAHRLPRRAMARPRGRACGSANASSSVRPEPPVGGHLGERAGGGRRPRQGRHQPLRGSSKTSPSSPGPRHPAPRQAPRRRRPPRPRRASWPT
jgi:PAS domain S-box-containing protein